LSWEHFCAVYSIKNTKKIPNKYQIITNKLPTNYKSVQRRKNHILKITTSRQFPHATPQGIAGGVQFPGGSPPTIAGTLHFWAGCRLGIRIQQQFGLCLRPMVPWKPLVHQSTVPVSELKQLFQTSWYLGLWNVQYAFCVSQYGRNFDNFQLCFSSTPPYHPSHDKGTGGGVGW
jgi:hypothetical protein